MSPHYILLESHFQFYWNSAFLTMYTEIIILQFVKKITGMTLEFSQDNILIICITGRNLLHDHPSNIHT